jgi:hypothetical protein
LPCKERAQALIARSLPYALLQDVVAGDGTTSVVVICGALLKKCQELLEKGVHPTIVSDSFSKAAAKACEVRDYRPVRLGDVVSSLQTRTGVRCRQRPVACAPASRSPTSLPRPPQILESIAIPVNMDDREALLKAATT